MIGLALPKRVGGKSGAAQRAGQCDRETRVRESILGRSRLARADLAQRPGEYPKRRGKDRGTQNIETPMLSLILRGEGPQQRDRNERDRRVDPEHHRPAKRVSEPASED